VINRYRFFLWTGIAPLLALAPVFFLQSTAGAVSPPAVSSALATPSTVTAGDPSTISWTVTNGAPLTYNTVHLYAPGGNQLPQSDCTSTTQVSGTSTDGDYESDCTIPDGLANGVYTTAIQVDDNLGNIINPSGPSITVTGSTVEAPPDVTTSLATPSTVVIGNPSTISWTVTNGAPLTYNSVHLYEPGGNQLPLSDCTGTTQVSGTSTDGNYQSDCTIPDGLDSGVYTTMIQVDDSLGNIIDPAGPSITVTGGIVVAPPDVANSLATPSTVAPGEPSTITWTVTNGAPLTYNTVHLYVPGGNQLPQSDCTNTTQTSGTSTDGNYQSICTIPAGLGDGVYTTLIQVDDNLGNVINPIGPSITVTSGSPSPLAPTPAPPTPSSATPTHGYWLVGTDGGVFNFGAAAFLGSTGGVRLQRPVVDVTPMANRGGYWLVASDGGVFALGEAAFYGSLPGVGVSPAGSGLGHSLNAPIVGMVPAANGEGYFLLASDGGVFAFGSGATFEGSCPGIGGCVGSAVAVMPDASGNGYWVVTQSGHVYTFGGAPYYGAPGQTGSPVTSAVRTPDGGGYWILTANGAVHGYGDATNLGSPPSSNFNGLDPATAIFATSDGGGYWVSSVVGHVFNFGDAPSDGGVSSTHLNGLIVAGAGF
jgi:hypothetical protein